MAMDYKRVLEKAEGYKPAISRFLRDLIALPSESCQEREVILRIKQEMEMAGFDGWKSIPWATSWGTSAEDVT